MLQIAGILTYHTATSQLDSIKSQVPGDYLILKNTIMWKLAQSVLPSTYHAPAVNISDFLDIDLLDLTKLGNPFQINDPRKCTELVP